VEGVVGRPAVVERMASFCTAPVEGSFMSIHAPRKPWRGEVAHPARPPVPRRGQREVGEGGFARPDQADKFPALRVAAEGVVAAPAVVIDRIAFLAF
jgi:hypothetical protein